MRGKHKDVCSNIPEKDIAISSFLFHPQTRWLTWKDWRWNLANTVVKHAVPYQFHSFIVLFRLPCGCWKKQPLIHEVVFFQKLEMLFSEIVGWFISQLETDLCNRFHESNFRLVRPLSSRIWTSHDIRSLCRPNRMHVGNVGKANRSYMI